MWKVDRVEVGSWKVGWFESWEVGKLKAVKLEVGKLARCELEVG